MKFAGASPGWREKRAEKGDLVVMKTKSIWQRNMRHTGRHTGLAEEIPKHRDPLLHRTFGALIRSEGMRAESDLVLASAQSSTDHRIRITVLTDFADSPADWRKAVDALAARTPAAAAARFAAHREWWHAFWERSWISIDSRSIGTEADSADAQAPTVSNIGQKFAALNAALRPLKRFWLPRFLWIEINLP